VADAKGLTRSVAEERLRRLRVLFSRLGADALLVTHLPNIRYLCGFTGSSAWLLVGLHQSTLFTDSRYTFQSRQEVVGSKVRIVKKGLLKGLQGALQPSRRLRLAYSPLELSVADWSALQAALKGRLRWVDARNLVESLRAIKNESELADMKAAALLISRVFIKTLPLIRPSVTELQLSSEIEWRMKQEGAEGASFETIVASGVRSAWAHARPTSKQLRKNELVVLDQGAILRGYCSDLTRTVFLGRPSPQVRRLYGAVLEAQAAANAAIRPGVTAHSVDAAARKALGSRGLGDYFTHSTGHGLGIEVHEMPRLGRRDRTILQEGMVLTVEPGVYLEGFGGIRIEDDVVVTSKGADDLTDAPRDFLQL